MPPRAALLIDQANEDFVIKVVLEIHYDRPEILNFAAGRFKKDLLRISADEFDTCIWPSTTGEKETAPRLCNFERDRRQSALWIIAHEFVAADPILALVIALHVRASLRHGVAAHGLSVKSTAGGSPIAERALFEIE